MTPSPQQDGEEEEAPPEWIPVELEMVGKLWLPDSEILRLKGFHSLRVLDKLQVQIKEIAMIGHRL